MKDFDLWNRLKKNIDLDIHFIPKNIKEGDIWWCSIGLNVGSEQDGGGDTFERPVLILKKYTKRNFLCLPITSKHKDGSYYYKIPNNIGSAYFAILFQAKVMDRNRFKRFIVSLLRSELRQIVEAYKGLI